MDSAQAVLSGGHAALVDSLDRRLVEMAARWSAQEFRFGPLISAGVLERIDWFRSFPQLVTFPAVLESTEDNLARFSEAEPVDSFGCLHPTAIAPIFEVLTPAACYHLYDHLQGVAFTQPFYATVRAPCFRREAHYVALERQWSFTMREIVCIGTAEETRSFVTQATADIDDLTAALGLTAAWAQASDPFFRPSRNPKYLMQQVDPTKSELIFDGHLAIASTNLHHDHFGRAFGIDRITGDNGSAPARTACVAFGLERWLAALISRHGPQGPWPAMDGPNTGRV